jgi:hypothetical protein
LFLVSCFYFGVRVASSSHVIEETTILQKLLAARSSGKPLPATGDLDDSASPRLKKSSGKK